MLSIEVLPSGKKRWLYRRRISGREDIVKLSLGLYPAYSIADARQGANGLNLQIDVGIDPRETTRHELRLATGEARSDELRGGAMTRVELLAAAEAEVAEAATRDDRRLEIILPEVVGARIDSLLETRAPAVN